MSEELSVEEKQRREEIQRHREELSKEMEREVQKLREYNLFGEPAKKKPPKRK